MAALTTRSLNHRRCSHHHPHPSCQLTATISTVPFTRFLVATHTLSNPLVLQKGYNPLVNFNPNSRWRGRSPAISPRPPSPPNSEPPTDEDQYSSSGLPAKLSRLQDTVQIFFAVFFWMSLFFWSCIWDGSKNNGPSDKWPPFRR